MAVVLKTVSSFGRVANICGGGAGARVWCGIESTRISKPNASFFKDQESSFLKFSQPAGIPARCQAAVAACPPPTRQAVGVLERPVEVEKLLPAPDARPETIDQHAEALPRSFLAESVHGNLVECSGRGSRPLYTNVLTGFQLSFTSTSQTEAVDHSAVKMAFHAALASAPDDARLLSEFAMFTWKSLDDLDAAEELYNKALELAPHDADIQASHALFLWQCDE
jgi:tetratricopeptide (TPR) repeat protein